MIPRGVLLILLCLCPPAQAADRLLVGVGDVTATTAVLWARGVDPGPLAVDYGPTGAKRSGSATLRVTPGQDLTGKLRLTGLQPATRYAYRARSGKAAATGEFVTAPAPDEPAPVRFLWSGDLGGRSFCRPVSGGYRIFAAMARRRPDFFLFVGDTVYADHRCRGPGVVAGADFVASTLAGFRRKHRYNREDPALSAFLAGTAVYAIWDDHEVRNNFAGPSEPLMAVGRQAFLEYWPILPPAEEPARLYRAFRWGGLLEVFILDTRQYRSPNHELDGAAKTMLGPVQRRWLIDGLAASPALWKVVVSSVPISVPKGRTNFDVWSNATVWGLPADNPTGFAVERDTILDALRERGVRNLVFVAADVHHAEIIRLRPAPDFTVYELVAGPLSAMHGRPRPLDQALDPQSLFARGGVNNFGEVTVEPAHLTVRIVDEDGTELFTHRIAPR